MSEPIEKDPHPLLAENRQLRAELDDLKSTNARLRGLFSNQAAESGQLWEELWQEVDERNKMRAEIERLRITSTRLLREQCDLRNEIERLRTALRDIAGSNPNHFEDPASHANWCMDEARRALEKK